MDPIAALFDLVKELPGRLASAMVQLSEQPWFLVLVAILASSILFELAKLLRLQRRTLTGCGFCASANGQPLTRVVHRWRWRGVVALETINPVTRGHIVVVSRWHTTDAGDDPRLTARVMRCAAELVRELPSANIITSKGSAATQTAFHLHVHVVPRRPDDDLSLPWTGQVIEEGVTAS